MASAPSSIASWISSIGTSVSLILAFYIILRDRRTHERSHASSITAWQEVTRIFYAGTESSPSVRIDIESVKIHMHNSSGMPVTNVTLISRTMVPRELRANFTSEQMNAYGIQVRMNLIMEDGSLNGSDNKSIRILLPGQEAHRILRPRPSLLPSSPLIAYRRWISFTDSAGITWFRDLSGGQLFRVGTLGTRRQLRGTIWPTPGFDMWFQSATHNEGPPNVVVQLELLMSRFFSAARRLIRRSR